MRKYILLLTLSLLLIGNGYAQTQNKPDPEWNVGIGFGPTFSSVSFVPTRPSTYLNTSYTNGFQGGVAVRYISDKNVGLLAELNYSQLGWKEDFGDNNIEGYEYTRTLDYIELPILTHIYIGNKVRFIINLGPKFGFNIGGKEKMNNALREFLDSEDVPEDKVTYQYGKNTDIKFDYALMGGLGVEFRTGIGNFSLEGRYSFGLGDIYKNSKTDVFSRSAHRNIYARLTYYTKLF
ncbi:porin family protein [Dysgonomonas sp. 520]|uniref:porin family protein n=1 Tax=Dysgonomonas sp. 520 TaxID=2302931 RepID=UPI0013CF79F4|nr:porin family protein [Dysgonomonas sp. 520]NDW10395.1 PorT family protein [Dysgonomonas sp. 520]